MGFASPDRRNWSSRRDTSDNKQWDFASANADVVADWVAISTDLSAANNASGSALLHETGFLAQWLYQHQDIFPEQLEVSFISLNGKRYIEVSFISGTTREARKSIVAVVTDLLR